MRWGFHYYIGFKLWSYSWFLCEILKFYGVCLEKVGLIILTLGEMFVSLRLVFIYNVVLTVWSNNCFGLANLHILWFVSERTRK